MSKQVIDQWYIDNLVCPIDKSSLRYEDGELISDTGRTYPVIEGVPVMLIKDKKHTIQLASASLNRSQKKVGALDERASELYLESLGISEEEKEGIIQLSSNIQNTIDPVVSFLVGATNGYAYKDLIGKLNNYPIPELRLTDGQGETLLDIGCSWGRWSIAAAKKNYDVVGLDPSLGAIMAAKRVTKQLGLSAKFIVGDARYLPFRSESFDHVFSYSVLQHFSKNDATISIGEVGRVLRYAGSSMIQMPNFMGIRSLQHQFKRKFREPVDFEVRYYSIPEIKKIFDKKIGTTELSVDCYFGLGLQKSDLEIMPPKMKPIIKTSEAIRILSTFITPLKYVADSIYAYSVK